MNPSCRVHCCPGWRVQRTQAEETAECSRREIYRPRRAVWSARTNCDHSDSQHRFRKTKSVEATCRNFATLTEETFRFVRALEDNPKRIGPESLAKSTRRRNWMAHTTWLKFSWNELIHSIDSKHRRGTSPIRLIQSIVDRGKKPCSTKHFWALRLALQSLWKWIPDADFT